MGFAYDVFGNGTMSLRGGYGIGYERNFGNVTFNVIQNPPNYAVISVVSGTDVPKGTLPIYVNNVVRWPVPAALAVATRWSCPGTSCFPNPSLRAVQQNIPTAYIQFWSGAMDYQVLKNSVLSFEYTGSKGTHEYDIANLNAGGYGSTFLGDARTANRLNYQYTNINYRGSEGFNEYNGLNVKFQTNNLFNKGLYLNANYTWSHAIDNLSSAFSDGYSSGYGLGYLDPYNANLDKGNADYDIRNRFVLSGTWNLPWGNSSSNAVERQVLGGWSFSPILNIRSGLPYSIYDCTNLGATRLHLPALDSDRSRSTRTVRRQQLRRQWRRTCSTTCHCRSTRAPEFRLTRAMRWRFRIASTSTTGTACTATADCRRATAMPTPDRATGTLTLLWPRRSS